MKSVLTFNMADNFIERLALFIDENYIKQGQDMDRVAIVFGGHRPRLFLQKELSLKT